MGADMCGYEMGLYKNCVTVELHLELYMFNIQYC